MERKTIIKRILAGLVFALLASLGVSLGFTWTKYRNSIDCFDAGQAFYILWLMNIGACLLSFMLSLFALLNMKESVRRNFKVSLLVFVGPSLLLLLALFFLFLINRNSHEGLSDFFDLGLSVFTFCLAFAYQFYRFRRKVIDKAYINQCIKTPDTH